MKEKHWHYYVCSLGYGDTTDLCCGHTPAGYTVVCVCVGGGGGGGGGGREQYYCKPMCAKGLTLIPDCGRVLVCLVRSVAHDSHVFVYVENLLACVGHSCSAVWGACCDYVPQSHHTLD